MIFLNKHEMSHNPLGCPKGIKHKTHLTKAEMKDFIMFCFRDDIADKLEQVVRPHQVAVKLYEKETGKKISTTTAYNQKGRWQMVNGELCEIKKRKDLNLPPIRSLVRPKTPKRKIPFEIPPRPLTPAPTQALTDADETEDFPKIVNSEE